MTHPLTAEVSLGQGESGYREGRREGAWGDGGGGRTSYSIGENYQTATQISSQPEHSFHPGPFLSSLPSSGLYGTSANTGLSH